MLRLCAYIKLTVALMLTLVSCAYGQSPATTPQKEVVVSETKTVAPENKVATPETRPNDLHTEVETLKAENAAVRELLRKMEEQQKVLLEQVDRLQRRFDGAAPPPRLAEAAAPLPSAPSPAVEADSANASAQPTSTPQEPPKGGHYNDGIIIWETSDDAPVSFQLKFTNTTQVRYLNTLSANDTFTDHLGNVREVHKRNDITVNRSMFVFNGYVFDKRARYNLTVWTSAGAASIVVAGNIGWQFNKALTITGGYTGVPGSRSLVNTFPFFTHYSCSVKVTILKSEDCLNHSVPSQSGLRYTE